MKKQIFVMPAWMAGIQVCKDASGDIHVNLDSSAPCWNDGIVAFYLNRPRSPRPYFQRRALKRALCVSVVLVFALLAACRQKMADQPRYEPLVRSTFFEDGRAARPLVEGTVARGELRGDELLYTGKEGGKPADLFPFPVTLAVLTRGQQRYNIFCSPCHDRVGTGQGMIVRRGYRAPASFHMDRLRQAPAGYFFDVISNGFGVMPDYAQQVHPEDRWAIVAYIRALQLSQHATLADVPEGQRQQLGNKP
ncbi:MAG TPA: cytochrome c [Candidatus Binatia bacterium]